MVLEAWGTCRACPEELLCRVPTLHLKESAVRLWLEERAAEVIPAAGKR